MTARNFRLFGHLLANGTGLVADGFQNAEFMEVPDEVFAPVAGADDGDVRGEELGVIVIFLSFR